MLLIVLLSSLYVFISTNSVTCFIKDVLGLRFPDLTFIVVIIYGLFRIMCTVHIVVLI